MIKSKFKVWVFIPIILLFFVTVLLYQIVYGIFIPTEYDTPIFIYFLIIVLVYVWIWILGLGLEKAFDLSEFDGFITCQLPSRGETYEYLYLIKNGKKEVKLSEFYHRNYLQLKNRITKTVHFLGDQPFSMLEEIKEIFV